MRNIRIIGVTRLHDVTRLHELLVSRDSTNFLIQRNFIIHINTIKFPNASVDERKKKVARVLTSSHLLLLLL